MKQLIIQEIYKQFKNKHILKHSRLLLFMMIGLTILIQTDVLPFSLENTVSHLMFTPPLIVFIMVATASSIIAMEFQFGTIKTLLFAQKSRTKILFSKIIALFCYSLYLYGLAILTTILIQMLFLPKLSWNHSLAKGHTFLMNFILNVSGNFIGLWLFVSLVLFITCLLRSATSASIIGIASYFLSSMIAGIQFSLIAKWDWVKWNPFNMLNLSNQLNAPKRLLPLTNLNTGLMLLGNLFYIALLLFGSYWSFQRRNV